MSYDTHWSQWNIILGSSFYYTSVHCIHWIGNDQLCLHHCPLYHCDGERDGHMYSDDMTSAASTKSHMTFLWRSKMSHSRVLFRHFTSHGWLIEYENLTYSILMPLERIQDLPDVLWELMIWEENEELSPTDQWIHPPSTTAQQARSCHIRESYKQGSIASPGLSKQWKKRSPSKEDSISLATLLDIRFLYSINTSSLVEAFAHYYATAMKGEEESD